MKFKLTIVLLVFTACVNNAGEITAGDLKLQVPDAWRVEQPSSSMRKAQLRIPAAEGDKDDGEYVVFYFGPQQGGSVRANIDRWIGQFEAEGRNVVESAGDAAAGKYNLASITGTYNKPVGPPIMRKSVATPGQKMLAVVLQTDSGSYFIKFTGPQKTVTAAEKDFKASFGAK